MDVSCVTPLPGGMGHDDDDDDDEEEEEEEEEKGNRARD